MTFSKYHMFRAQSRVLPEYALFPGESGTSEAIMMSGLETSKLSRSISANKPDVVTSNSNL
jgi:hypothetical protein